MQNTIKKTTDRATRIPLKTGSEHQSIWFVFLQDLLNYHQKLVLPCNVLLKCPYKARKVSVHAYIIPTSGKQHILISLSLVWPLHKSNQRSRELQTSRLTIVVHRWCYSINISIYIFIPVMISRKKANINITIQWLLYC